MLVVNGKPLDLKPMPETVHELLEQLKLSHRRLIVEKNKKIVNSSHYDTEPLSSGDRIEIVHFVGGG